MHDGEREREKKPGAVGSIACLLAVSPYRAPFIVFWAPWSTMNGSGAIGQANHDPHEHHLCSLSERQVANVL